MFCDGRSAAPSNRRIWRGSASDRGGGRIRIARRGVPQSIANTNAFVTVCVSGCCGAFKAANEMCENLQSFCNDSGPPSRPLRSPFPRPAAASLSLSLSLSLSSFLWFLCISVSSCKGICALVAAQGEKSERGCRWPRSRPNTGVAQVVAEKPMLR